MRMPRGLFLWSVVTSRPPLQVCIADMNTRIANTSPKSKRVGKVQNDIAFKRGRVKLTIAVGVTGFKFAYSAGFKKSTFIWF